MSKLATLNIQGVMVVTAVDRLDQFRKDLNLVLEHYRITALARKLGVHPDCIHLWRQGKYLPRETLTYEIVKICAVDIRKQLPE